MAERNRPNLESFYPDIKERMEALKRDVKKLRSCEVHEFSMSEMREAVLKNYPLSWQKAKVRCRKCGVSFFALYAGGYMDALRDMKRAGGRK